MLEQNPPEGARVPVGTIVELTVAAPVTAPIPDVRGLQLEAARELLASRNFGVGTVKQINSTAKPLPGEVLVQDPPPRPVRPLGTGVALQIMQGAPNVVGLLFAEAKPVIEGFGLQLNDPIKRESDAPVDMVLKQAGPVGSKVTLTLAIPFAIIVPNLTGLTVEAATAQLAALRLGLEPIGTIESDATPGVIADQVPKANAKLPPAASSACASRSRACRWRSPSRG